MWVDEPARGAVVSEASETGQNMIADVNGVPIMQVGPEPVEVPSPAAAPGPQPGQDQSRVLLSVIPQQPAHVPQPPVAQPAVEQPSYVSGYRPPAPRRRGFWVLPLLTGIAVLFALGFVLSTCGAMLGDDGPDYQHEDLGGSNAMDGEGGVASPFDGLDLLTPPDLGDLGDGADGGPGAAIGVGDPDDGELHPYWDDTVSYTVREERMVRAEQGSSDAYGARVACDFSIAYPQLEGDLEHLDQINALIRESALGYYDQLYANPTEDMVARVQDVVEEGEDIYVSDTAEYVVSYNSDHLVSICWSHNLMTGSVFTETLRLETLNIDLDTGETYELADVLEVNEAQATAWVDNLLRFDSGIDTQGMFGRDAMIQGVMGQGEWAGRTRTTIFVDADGTPNLGVSFMYGNDSGILRGWWDVTLTDELLEGSRKDSRFWELLPEGGATPALNGPTTSS